MISICCLTCQTGSVCFPVFAVDWYMSSILFAGVTTEYTPTLPTRGKKKKNNNYVLLTFIPCVCATVDGMRLMVEFPSASS